MHIYNIYVCIYLIFIQHFAYSKYHLTACLQTMHHFIHEKKKKKPLTACPDEYKKTFKNPQEHSITPGP